MILHNIGHSVKKTSRIRSRTVKGLVSVSSRLLGVSVSSRKNFPMSRSRLGLEAERLGSRLGLGHEGLVSIPAFGAHKLLHSEPFLDYLYEL